MAHADYACCAICDSKMYYDADAHAKEELCVPCAVDLAERGVFVRSVDELEDWMCRAPKPDVVRILEEIGFRYCLYGGVIDDLARSIGVRGGE